MDWDKIVKVLPSIIEKLKAENMVEKTIIRDDIFKILEKHCIVIYYPFADEDNCGFHTRRSINNEWVDFVYINTGKSLSKQVFTAAHELGHVWDVKEKILHELSEYEDFTTEEEEQIINRFAAELMMPSESFRKSFLQHLQETVQDTKYITLENLVRVIVLQMNDYMVPYEAVRRRMVETEIIYEKDASILKNKKDDIKALVVAFSKDQNTVLDKATEKKTIPGLRVLLKTIEQKKALDEYTVSKIKKDFEMNNINSINEVINILGAGNNGED